MSKPIVFPVIFRELPETFPAKDKYKKTSVATSLLVHGVLIAILLTIPFLFLEQIPQFQLLTELVAPPPPPAGAPPAPALVATASKPAAPTVAPVKPADSALIMPTVVPREIARVVEAPENAEGVIGGVPGGTREGAMGGVIGNLLARNSVIAAPLEAPPLPPPPPPAIEAPRAPVRVGGDIREPRVAKLVPPKYPPLASKARVHGAVVLEATLREDGTVDAIHVISGHPLLVNAAIDCVRQWRYEPTLLNGQPVAVILTATVNFKQAPISEKILDMKDTITRLKPNYIVRPRTALLTRGFDPALSVGSARPAVFRSSTFVFPSPEAAEHAFAVALGKSDAIEEGHGDLIYARLAHPNGNILEDQILALEPGARGAAVFNSGMAAITTLFLTICEPGSSFVYTVPLYGGTFHFIHRILEPLGIRGIAVPAGATSAMARAIRDAPDLRLVFIETPANPTLTMTDIETAVVEARARRPRVVVAVDNTLMGPVFQHPLSLGADVAVYSATKYLSGFSDMLAGVILGSSPEFIEELRATRAIFGNILQADESWLLDSRLPTVAFRMNRQSKNAQHIVEALVERPRIEKIHYPKLFVDPEQKRIRDAQCGFSGGLFSLELKDGKCGAFNFLRNLKLIRIAVSLGGVESLACHPATTTHSEIDENDREALGITDNLVRISIGVEDWRDLLRDILEAL